MIRGKNVNRKEADGMEDQALLHLLKEEPDHGIELFIRQYAGLVYSIVAGRAGGTASAEDIEECVSDVIYEIYRRADSIDLTKGSLQAWTAVVAKNRAINLYRKTARELGRTAPMEGLDAQADTADSEQAVLHADERKRLLEAVKSLGEPDSEIILRKYYFGQRSKEIARDLGMTVSSVDTRLSRAMNKLRAIWGGK